jgi:hypothetical protein
MTTSLGSLSQRWRFVAAGAWFVSVMLVGNAGATLAAEEQRLPQDDAAILVELEVGETPAPRLTKEDALAKAMELYGEDAMGASKVDAHLVSATPEIALRTPGPTWIVHMSGMGMVMTGPAEEEDTPVATAVVDNLYVYIDAVTGEFLMGIWTK